MSPQEQAAQSFILNAMEVMSQEQREQFIERTTETTPDRECIIIISQILDYEQLLCAAILTEDEMVTQ